MMAMTTSNSMSVKARGNFFAVVMIEILFLIFRLSSVIRLAPATRRGATRNYFTFSTMSISVFSRVELSWKPDSCSWSMIA